MRVHDNLEFLDLFVSSAPCDCRYLLIVASEKELKTLMECVLYFDSVPLADKEKQLLNKQYKRLLEFSYKNIEEGRSNFLKCVSELSDLVDIVKSSLQQNGTSVQGRHKRFY